MDFINDSEIVKILYSKLIGEISDEQQRVLDEWADRSPQNRELYDGLTSGNDIGEYERLLDGMDIASRKERIGRKIYKNNRRRLAIRASSVAAVLLIGVISATMLLRVNIDSHPAVPEQQRVILSFDDGREIVLTEEEQGDEWKKHIQADRHNYNLKIAVPTGSEYHLTLSDGTAVWLNSETVFEYPSEFTDGRREVVLSGEAYFEVARNEEMPFVVSAPNDVSVTVLGTSFNLSAYEADHQSVATLVSGAVEVCSAATCVTLSPGSQAVIDNDAGAISVADVNADQYISWTQGIFEFDMMPLEDVAARLARWYGVEFVFEGGSGQKLFTGGTWKNVALKDFLERIGMVTNVSFRYNGDTVIVSAR